MGSTQHSQINFITKVSHVPFILLRGHSSLPKIILSPLRGQYVPSSSPSPGKMVNNLSNFTSFLSIHFFPVISLGMYMLKIIKFV